MPPNAQNPSFLWATLLPLSKAAIEREGFLMGLLEDPPTRLDKRRVRIGGSRCRAISLYLYLSFGCDFCYLNVCFITCRALMDMSDDIVGE